MSPQLYRCLQRRCLCERSAPPQLHCHVRVSYKSVKKASQARVSYRSIKQECLTRVSSKKCQVRVPSKSVLQECQVRSVK